MRTCRCPMCGTNSPGRKNKSKRLYTAHGVGTDENGRFWNAAGKDEARRLLRRRMAARLPAVIAEFD